MLPESPDLNPKADIDARRVCGDVALVCCSLAGVLLNPMNDTKKTI
jgi:hypothetical protein